jgi:phosphoglycolate phosphatase
MTADSGGVAIRPIEIGDVESIAWLYEHFWREQSNVEAMRRTAFRVVSDPRQTVLCAIVDRRIVGTASAAVCDDLYGHCAPFLVMENLIVDPDYRKRGIGRSLVSRLEAFGREHGCRHIHFITDAHRTEAIRFYEALGCSAQTHIGFKKEI